MISFSLKKSVFIIVLFTLSISSFLASDPGNISSPTSENEVYNPVPSIMHHISDAHEFLTVNIYTVLFVLTFIRQIFCWTNHICRCVLLYMLLAVVQKYQHAVSLGQEPQNYLANTLAPLPDLQNAILRSISDQKWRTSLHNLIEVIHVLYIWLSL